MNVILPIQFTSTLSVMQDKVKKKRQEKKITLIHKNILGAFCQLFRCWNDLFSRNGLFSTRYVRAYQKRLNSKVYIYVDFWSLILFLLLQQVLRKSTERHFLTENKLQVYSCVRSIFLITFCIQSKCNIQTLMNVFMGISDAWMQQQNLYLG